MQGWSTVRPFLRPSRLLWVGTGVVLLAAAYRAFDLANLSWPAESGRAQGRARLAATGQAPRPYRRATGSTVAKEARLSLEERLTLDELLASEEICWAEVARRVAEGSLEGPPGSRDQQVNRLGDIVAGHQLSGEDLRLLVEALGTFHDRATFAGALASSLSVQRSAESLDLAEGFPEPSLQRLVIRRVAARWSEVDWRAAAGWADSLNAGLTSEAAWEGVLAGAGTGEPEAVLEWAQEHGLSNAGNVAIAKQARELASEAPSTAVALVAGLPPSQARTRSLGYALGRWAAHSPSAVIEWAQSQNDPGSRGLGLMAAVRAWGRTDPQAALEWVQGWTGSDQAGLQALALAQLRADAAPPAPDDSPPVERPVN